MKRRSYLGGCQLRPGRAGTSRDTPTHRSGAAPVPLRDKLGVSPPGRCQNRPSSAAGSDVEADAHLPDTPMAPTNENKEGGGLLPGAERHVHVGRVSVICADVHKLTEISGY